MTFEYHLDTADLRPGPGVLVWNLLDDTGAPVTTHTALAATN